MVVIYWRSKRKNIILMKYFQSDTNIWFSGQYYKCFTIVIYDRNDSGQYYKTTIIVITSLS
jgi:hypothetical protein